MLTNGRESQPDTAAIVQGLYAQAAYVVRFRPIPEQT